MNCARVVILIVCLGFFTVGCGSRAGVTGQNSASAPSGGASTGTSTGDSGATSGTSGNVGTSITNLQTASGNWRSWGQAGPSYVDCSAPCSEASWEQKFGIADPSLSGDATMFELDPNVPYADALFSAGLIGQNSPQLPDTNHTLLPTLHNFTYDTDFYVVTPEVTQALEFDISMALNTVDLTWGHQCNYLGDGQWDIWDNVSGQWKPTGFPCAFQAGWNHLTLQMQREPDNTLLYQSITLNGTTFVVNQTSAPGVSPEGWWGVAANYQMDSDYQGAPSTTYLDKMTVTYW